MWNKRVWNSPPLTNTSKIIYMWNNPHWKLMKLAERLLYDRDGKKDTHIIG